jgi:parvulin-like peptidyl-prolyl isomerase
MRNHRHSVAATLVLLVGLAGCQKAPAKDKPSTGSGQGSDHGATAGSAAKPGAPTPAKPPAEAKDIDSKDILGRLEPASEVYVKHVLVAWSDLAESYGGRIDPRAAKRSNAEAAALAQSILAKLKASPDAIDAQIQEHSEDPGSLSGDPYTVRPDSQLVPEFKNLALRLKDKEVGIVKSSFGYHVMERVGKPAPDPVESTDIITRTEAAKEVQIQHIVIEWKDAPIARAGHADPRAVNRTKAEADKLAKEVLAKVRANGDMVKLMKEYSEDAGTKDNGKVIPITADMQIGDQFTSLKNLALRLKLNEAGLAKSPMGWHIVKHVPPPPPPPPDSLDSVDILKREPTTAKAKVKHILLGWTAVHASDERGTKRDRAALEKLVKETVAKLKKGDKIEPLMAELSEDPGSAKDGKDYDVSPDAQLVPPFKNLSLRLKVGEVGVVKSDFGIHIIQRTE